MEIRTNNKPRHIIYGYELPSSKVKEFDYYNEEELHEASFFKYKGQYYDLSQFLRTEINKWQGVAPDTAFSGILIRYVNDNDSVIVAQYFS